MTMLNEYLSDLKRYAWNTLRGIFFILFCFVMVTFVTGLPAAILLYSLHKQSFTAWLVLNAVWFVLLPLIVRVYKYLERLGDKIFRYL